MRKQVDDKDKEGRGIASYTKGAKYSGISCHQGLMPEAVFSRPGHAFQGLSLPPTISCLLRPTFCLAKFHFSPHNRAEIILESCKSSGLLQKLTPVLGTFFPAYERKTWECLIWLILSTTISMKKSLRVLSIDVIKGISKNNEILRSFSVLPIQTGLYLKRDSFHCGGCFPFKVFRLKNVFYSYQDLLQIG